MADEMYYKHGGRQHGPVTGAELKELAAAGKLLPDDLIWKEGMEKWVPARSVKGLFPPAPTPTTVAAPKRGHANDNVPGNGAPAGKVVPPARTAKSAGVADKTPQTEQPEPLPLPDEDDDGPQPKKTRGGKLTPPSVSQAKGLLDKGKGVWRRLNTPARAGIIGGAVLGGLLVLVIPVLIISSPYFPDDLQLSARHVRRNPGIPSVSDHSL